MVDEKGEPVLDFTQIRPRGLDHASLIAHSVKAIQEFQQQTTASLAQKLTRATAPPSTSISSGTPGEVAYDETHVFICVKPNQWGRFALDFDF